jgi:hypothetical protein
MRVMSRVVSLYLPTWPTDRLRRKMGAGAPDAAMPLVLVGQTGRRREVVAANAAAWKVGLRVGMPATKAQALVKELLIPPPGSPSQIAQAQVAGVAGPPREMKQHGGRAMAMHCSFLGPQNS